MWLCVCLFLYVGLRLWAFVYQSVCVAVCYCVFVCLSQCVFVSVCLCVLCPSVCLCVFVSVCSCARVLVVFFFLRYQTEHAKAFPVLTKSGQWNPCLLFTFVHGLSLILLVLVRTASSWCWIPVTKNITGSSPVCPLICLTSGAGLPRRSSTPEDCPPPSHSKASIPSSISPLTRYVSSRGKPYR